MIAQAVRSRRGEGQYQNIGTASSCRPAREGGLHFWGPRDRLRAPAPGRPPLIPQPLLTRTRAHEIARSEPRGARSRRELVEHYERCAGVGARERRSVARRSFGALGGRRISVGAADLGQPKRVDAIRAASSQYEALRPPTARADHPCRPSLSTRGDSSERLPPPSQRPASSAPSSRTRPSRQAVRRCARAAATMSSRRSSGAFNRRPRRRTAQQVAGARARRAGAVVGQVGASRSSLGDGVCVEELGWSIDRRLRLRRR